jgi:hypothetical protein
VDLCEHEISLEHVVQKVKHKKGIRDRGISQWVVGSAGNGDR